MITIAQAKKLGYRHEIYHLTLRDSTGHSLRARVNGKIKLWKTIPGIFKLPMKHGLRDTFYLTQLNADQWSLKAKHTGK
jgi:hypothetical protein